MNEPEIEPRLRSLIREVTRQDMGATSLDADLVRELGLDSLAALRVLAAVEKRFDIHFPDEHLAEYRTLRQLRDFIAQAQAGGTP